MLTKILRLMDLRTFPWPGGYMYISLVCDYCRGSLVCFFFTSVLKLVNSFNLGTVNPAVSGVLAFISLRASCPHFPALRTEVTL